MLNQLQLGDEPALLPCRRSGFLRRPQIDQLFDAAAEPSLGWAAGSPYPQLSRSAPGIIGACLAHRPDRAADPGYVHADLLATEQAAGLGLPAGRKHAVAEAH